MGSKYTIHPPPPPPFKDTLKMLDCVIFPSVWLWYPYQSNFILLNVSQSIPHNSYKCLLIPICPYFGSSCPRSVPRHGSEPPPGAEGGGREAAGEGESQHGGMGLGTRCGVGCSRYNVKLCGTWERVNVLGVMGKG